MAKKPMFSAGAFDDLRAASGETTGAPLRLALNIIDEDPNQPRTIFDDAELETLAESIRLRGVLQPIGVMPAEDGRHRLVFGARRYRASKIAEQADIPAVIVPEAQRDLATQVIENQQRANLANSDLASVVNQLFGQGQKLKQIAAICNLPEYLVSYYRGAASLPAVLAGKIDKGDIRAIYELSNAWKKNPAEIESAMQAHDGYLSVTEARRIIESATGKATSSVFLTRKDETPAAPLSPAVASEKDEEASPSQPAVLDQPPPQAEPVRPSSTPLPMAAEQVPEPRMPAPAPVSQPEAVPAVSKPKKHTPPLFIVEVDGEQGELLTELRSEKADFAFVQIGTAMLEVPFAELRCIGVR